MDDPRATKIITNSQEQQEIQAAIEYFIDLDNITLDNLLEKAKEMPEFRKQPQIINNLFQNHLHIIVEMIEWTLMPKTIAKRKKVKKGIQIYTQHSKQFMQNNWSFYESLFLAIYQKKLPFRIFLQFLKPQYYDEQTVNTALGYFSQIMVPFARYEFSGSYYLSNSMDLSNQNNESFGIMTIMPYQFIDQLLKYCHYWSIYEFLTTAVLVGLQGEKQLEASIKTIQNIFQYCQVPGLFEPFTKGTNLNQSFDNYQYICRSADLQIHVQNTMDQLINNIEPKVFPSNRALIIISSYLNSKLIPYAIKQLQQSRRCKQQQSKIKKESQYSSSMEHRSSKSLSSISFLYSSQQIFVKNKQVKFDTPEVCQDDIIQTLLKILKQAIAIYMKLPKEFNKKQCQQDLNEPNQQLYANILDQYRLQIQHILDHMPTLNKLVYNCNFPARQIPFSSGQQIKQISFMKYQYFDLLYHCLVILQHKDIETLEQKQMETSSILSSGGPKITGNSQDSPQGRKKPIFKKSFSLTIQPFNLDVQKLYVIQVIEKYFSENRWNNITHHILQKICHVLIVSKYEYIRKNIQKDYNKKLSDSFLAYLIQNFTQRDYIYLDTMRFTSQGNLHSLYNIAKFLAYTLNSTNQLVILLNQFAPWKKFLMNDLGKYEQKTFPVVSLPENQDLTEMTRKSTQVYEQIKVDEVDSIRKLIQNISIAKKWPRRQKGASKSMIFRKSLEHSQKSDNYMYQSHGGKRMMNDESDTLLLDRIIASKCQKLSVVDNFMKQYEDIDDENLTTKSEVYQKKKKHRKSANSQIHSK